MKRAGAIVLSMLLMAVTLAPASASSHRKRRREAPSLSPGNFDYYLLALSWAPDFCAISGAPKDPRECGKGRRVNFVVHGLWPQKEQSRGPERCDSVSPVSQDLVQVMLNYMPTESLIQHEWAYHGTCSGLSAADYFAAVRKARDSVKLPNELKAPAQQQQLSPATFEAEFAAANPNFPKAAFQVSCRNGELQEARICFAKDLTPRACSASAGECSDPTMIVRPVQ